MLGGCPSCVSETCRGPPASSCDSTTTCSSCGPIQPGWVSAMLLRMVAPPGLEPRRAAPAFGKDADEKVATQ